MAEEKRENKKYYWIRLPKDFFNSKEMKKLRTIAGGEIFTIIYLKMQLLSIDRNALLEFDGTEETMAEQLSYEIDESKENIAMTIGFLLKHNLIELLQDDIDMLQTKELIGIETASTIRSRKHRMKKNALQSNTGATQTQQLSNAKKEIEKEIELDKKNTSSNKSLTENDFEELWKLYPKKANKKDGLNAYKKAIKNGTTKEEVLNGINKYNEYLRLNKEWLKPMDGGRWFQKERWLDEYDMKGEQHGEVRTTVPDHIGTIL